MNGNPAEITQRLNVGLGLQCAVLLPFVVIGALLMGVRGWGVAALGGAAVGIVVILGVGELLGLPRTVALWVRPIVTLAVLVPVVVLVKPDVDPVVLVAIGVLVSVVTSWLWARPVGRQARRTSPGQGQDVP